jgi:putative hydrolase of the HAD superfamily
LTRLKQDGYKLGLISNCSIEIPILWEETELADLIDSPIFSCRERLKKPDPHIYHLACERLGVVPRSCLYVADGEVYELSGAGQVGMHPVLIRTAAQDISKSHQEARDWQGTAIAELADLLQLVRDKR